ncbi:MAG: TRAP transporter substrate-binding protein [Acidobacteriota bacterium]
MQATAIALLLVLAPAACQTDDSTQPLELKFGHVGAPGSLFAVSAEEFARRANERLGERAKVVVFGSSQLGGDEVLLQKLKLGTVDLALPSTIMSSYVDEFGLFEMPYLVNDRQQMRRIEKEIFWPQLAPLAEAKGYKIIAVWENGFRHVTNNVRPITTPADLDGIKLRTPRGRWRLKMFQVLGANPTPMPLSEVFVALQTGVMDGQENPLAQIYSSKLYEVQSYLSLTRHVYTPAYVTVSPDRWAQLPEDLRNILEEAARQTQEFVYATAARMDRELLEKIEATGVRVNDPDLVDFLEASRAVYAEFARSVPGGKKLLERAIELGNS